MSDDSTATIAIPQFGRTELTRQCVQSIRAAEQRLWPILIIDDGSPPGDSPEQLATEFRAVTVNSQAHSGVTAAWNTALETVATSSVIFLNNDVRVSGRFVDRLLAPLIDRRTDMTGAAMRIETKLPSDVLADLPCREFLQGWCFAADAGRLRAIGGFDPRMQLYWSDTDLQLRVVQHSRRLRSPLTVVKGLPLILHGHATAHAMPDFRKRWSNDRSVFLRKWAGDGNASTIPCPSASFESA